MLSPPAFAQTYEPTGDTDPDELLRDYYAVRGYVDTHSDASNADAERALDVPAHRVRAWRDGQVPDVVTGYRRALDRGWFTGDADVPVGRSLALLVTAVIACGWLTTRPRPGWSPATPSADAAIWDAIRTLALDPRRGTVADDRPMEITVGDGSTILGRALLALGAPQGEKTAETVPPLPDSILEAGDRTRRACAEVYLLERATGTGDKDTVSVPMQNRSEAFRRSVANLLRSLTDADITVGETLTVSAAAARDLDLDRDGRLGTELRSR